MPSLIKLETAPKWKKETMAKSMVSIYSVQCIHFSKIKNKNGDI